MADLKNENNFPLADFKDADSSKYPALRKATYFKVSEEAAKIALNQLKQAGDGIAGVKIDIKTKGCSGLSYSLELALENENYYMTEIVELENGLTIFIDPKAALFLFGVTLHYENSGIEYGFQFINPNEGGRCGCNKSFFVKEKPVN